MRSRTNNFLVHLLSTYALLVIFGPPTAAQLRRVPRYEPQTPTTSPYLNFFNPGGAAGNYYTIVRPLQTQRDLNRQQTQRLQAQNMRLDQVQTQLDDPTVRETGRASWFNQLAPSSSFQNRSHFYDTWDSRSLGRR